MAGKKQSVSVEEQGKRTRDYQRKRREKVNSDPDSRRGNHCEEKTEMEDEGSREESEANRRAGREGAEASEKVLEGCSEKV